MEPAFIIKPNVKKLCTINIIKVAAAVAIIAVVVTYSRYIFDFSMFKDLLDINQEDLPSTGRLAMNFIAAIVLTGLITFALTYMSASKRQYLFYQDKLEIDDNFLIFNINKKEIPLTNVVSINPEKKGEKAFFGLGKIVIQLTAMEEKSVELEDLDQPEYYVPYIQKLLDQIKEQMRSDYSFNKKIDSTLSEM